MPTATSFNAGVGNGFAACLSKVDVSGFDFWTTFSGVNKDSPTTSDALISESLELAMALFWNVAEMEGLADILDNLSGGGASASVLTTGVTSKLPDTRACSDVISFSASDTSDINDEVFSLMGVTARPVRMYNGDETDEDNFVGFGISTTLRAISNGVDLDIFASIRMRSFEDGDSEVTGYTEINGLHFVCKGQASPNGVIDTSGRSASATSGSSHADARIDSLDFYTY